MQKIVITLAIIFLAACGNAADSGENSASPLIGSWQLEDQLHLVLTFHENGTGRESFEGNEFDFTWQTQDDFLTFAEITGLDGTDIDQSILNALMEMEIHGETLSWFGFEFPEENTLYLLDDHDHGHFLLIFSRID